jgi:hypothetical protein
MLTILNMGISRRRPSSRTRPGDTFSSASEPGMFRELRRFAVRFVCIPYGTPSRTRGIRGGMVDPIDGLLGHCCALEAHFSASNFPEAATTP